MQRELSSVRRVLSRGQHAATGSHTTWNRPTSMLTSLSFAFMLIGQSEPKYESMSDAVAIAISGITIVFVALILISLFIAGLPRLLEMVAEVWPEVEDRHAMTREGHPESQVADDAPVIAAIGYVLHTEMQKQLAAERSSSGKG